jgi:hypothetical protein
MRKECLYFNENNDLVVAEDDRVERAGISKWYLPAKFVDMIYWNLKGGKEWWIASPIMSITRQIAAFILTEYKPKYGATTRRGTTETDRLK